MAFPPPPSSCPIPPPTVAMSCSEAPAWLVRRAIYIWIAHPTALVPRNEYCRCLSRRHSTTCVALGRAEDEADGEVTQAETAASHHCTLNARMPYRALCRSRLHVWSRRRAGVTTAFLATWSACSDDLQGDVKDTTGPEQVPASASRRPNTRERRMRGFSQ